MGFFRWMPCPKCCGKGPTYKKIGYEKGYWPMPILDALTCALLPYVDVSENPFGAIPLLMDNISRIEECWIAFFGMDACRSFLTDPPSPYSMYLNEGDWGTVSTYVKNGGVVWVSGEWNNSVGLMANPDDPDELNGLCMLDVTRDQINRFISAIGGTMRVGYPRAGCGGSGTSLDERCLVNYSTNSVRVMEGIPCIGLGWSGAVEGGTWLQRFERDPVENPECPSDTVVLAAEKVDKGYIFASCDSNLSYVTPGLWDVWYPPDYREDLNGFCGLVKNIITGVHDGVDLLV